MFKRLKTFIIHKLGGYLEEEFADHKHVIYHAQSFIPQKLEARYVINRHDPYFNPGRFDEQIIKNKLATKLINEMLSEGYITFLNMQNEERDEYIMRAQIYVHKEDDAL